MKQEETIIWRAIFLEKIEDLCIKHFGCHWSKNENYAYSTNFFNNDISEAKRKGDKMFLFKTIVAQEQINLDATKRSNIEYPDEEECVLKPNIFLKKVTLVNRENEPTEFSVNTGNRYDSWI
ncbi:hypothetical protein [uncultured Lutibacter sp.]|uniref:hypothetical protein n=1 Tax=uncultured Lutibacter sp. TaxID=437739 RepID=UPI00261C9B60|nr:hypothetical protein [uncultured Lutibacter sp.]